MASQNQIRAAEAILNARGGREGVLHVKNILDFVQSDVGAAALEDAETALRAAEEVAMVDPHSYQGCLQHGIKDFG